MNLYRPVGLKELRLISESGFESFPPRLFWQPIFYPVLTLEYAEYIAREWNTKDEASGYSGFVTAFELDREYSESFEVQKVGGAESLELWVPAEELETFNRKITGKIRIIRAYYGEAFSEEIDAATGLPKGIDAVLERGAP